MSHDAADAAAWRLRIEVRGRLTQGLLMGRYLNNGGSWIGSVGADDVGAIASVEFEALVRELEPYPLRTS